MMICGFDIGITKDSKPLKPCRH